MLTFRRAIRVSLQLLSLSLIGLAVQSPACGQDNPFGSDSPFAAPTADTSASPFSNNAAPTTSTPSTDPVVPSDAEPDPVIRALRARTPRTTSEMADGLLWASRLKRWDEVGRLLDVTNTRGWNLAQQAEVAKIMGAARLLQLRKGELTEAQRQVADSLFNAPAKIARDPQTIDAKIDLLASSNPAQRRLAQIQLQDGSSFSLRQLVNRLLAGDAKVAPVMLAGTATQFGDDGKDALRAACIVRDVNAAARVQLALADLPGSDFSAELGAALASRTMPAAQQAPLKEKLLSKYGSVPTPQAIEEFLAKQFSQKLDQYNQLRVSGSGTGADLSDTAWRPADNGNSIELAEVTYEERVLERLAQLGALRIELNVATDEDLIQSYVALLQRGYHIEPELMDEQVSPRLLALPNEQQKFDLDWWQQAFQQSETWQMHGAALRALQHLGNAAVQGEFEAPLDFLAKLLLDPRPMIRYSALGILEKLDPQQSYYGCDWAVRAAVEMSRLGTGPQALVIGLQNDLRQAAVQQINQQTGAQVWVANSGREAIRMLSQAQPIELVVIVDRLADQSLSELVQRVRQSAHGKSLPIAVLTDDLYPYEQRMIEETPGVVQSTLSRNSEQMNRVLSMLDAKLDTIPMSAADRATFAAIGTKFLTRIASNRDLYSFYSIQQWEEAMVAASNQATTSSQLELLSGIGTRKTQQQLAQLTVAGELTEEQQIDAAKAFAKSVRQFGMTMARHDVLEAYEQYNKLGEKNPNLVKALGLVLDVIEANAGKASWPTGL